MNTKRTLQKKLRIKVIILNYLFKERLKIGREIEKLKKELETIKS